MYSAELSSPKTSPHYPDTETDPLSGFLRSYHNEKEVVSSAEKEFQDELIKGIETLNKNLEGLEIPSKSNSLDAWITSEQVLHRLEISERTLASWRKSGKMPFSRIEQKFYYKIQDLEKLLSDGYQKKVKSETNK